MNRKYAWLKQYRITVLSGGGSSEKLISKKSGRAVYSQLKLHQCSAVLVDPSKKGELDRNLRQSDIVFIALHGKGGEDGQIQQYLDRKKVPYVGSGPRASYRAYNKIASKKILTKKNIPTAEYAELHPAAWQRQMSSIGLPVCVKPVYEGSSIGVFFVEDLKKSAEKVKRAFRMYGSMMAEKKIDGREFTVGILGRRALPVIELKPKRQFYDYCAKYTKGMTRYEVPARIPRRLARKMQKIALRTHAALGLRDLSRVDLMLDRQGRIFVLEANSIPGFTEFSLLPKAAAAAGIPFGEVCLGLLGRALKRSMTRKRQN